MGLFLKEARRISSSWDESSDPCCQSVISLMVYDLVCEMCVKSQL